MIEYGRFIVTVEEFKHISELAHTYDFCSFKLGILNINDFMITSVKCRYINKKTIEIISIRGHYK